MKPWFIREDNVVPFPKKHKNVVRLPNINAYPDFLSGVQDLQNHLKNGDISSDIHKKLYQDLIHRFMRTESFETPWFLREAVGISGRKLGDVFQNLKNPKDQITFDSFKAYPDNKMRFENMEEMLKEITNIEKKIPKLTQVNQPK